LDFLAFDPNNRLYWQLFDQYERITPTDLSIPFYDAPDWLHPDDPWVKQAVADWHARRDRVKLMSVQLLYPFPQVLNDFEPLEVPTRKGPFHREILKKIYRSATPCAAAHAIRDLLKQNKQDEARLFALRFQNLAVQTGQSALRAWAGCLVRRTNPG
jgi:hypothetical protein